MAGTIRQTRAQTAIIRRLLVIGLLSWPGAATADEANGIARIERLREPGSVPGNASLPQLQAAEFVPDEGGPLLRSRGAAGDWWRITPGAPATPSGSAASGERLLAIYNSYTAQVTVLSAPEYAPRTRRIFDRDLDPRYSRRSLVFSLASAGEEPVYVHVSESRGDPPWATVVAAPAYAAADHRYTGIMYTLQAMLATVALVVLLFWVRLRERVYLLFTFYIVLELAYLMANSGEAYAVPVLRMLGDSGAPGLWLLITLTLASSVFFVSDFADLRRLVPKLSRVYLGLGVVLLGQALLLLLPWPTSKEWYPIVGNLLLLPVQLVALVALGLAARRGGRHARYVLVAWIPLVVVTIWRGVQVQYSLRLLPWLEYGLPVAVAFCAVVLTYGLAVRMLSFRHERDQALRRAELDPLTGVLNHGAGLHRLDVMVDRTRSQRGKLSLLFLDLDHFKAINDRYGHPHGDACLLAVVATIGGELRQRDVLARFGGEEFVVLLPGTALEHAGLVAERIRRSVQTQCQTVAGQEQHLTVSIGVAGYVRDKDRVKDLVSRADAAVYQAKAEGRNRVVIAVQPEAGPPRFVSGDAIAAALTADRPSETSR